MADLMDQPWCLPQGDTTSSPPRLPVCIPTTYHDEAGRYCLAYPRSPFNRDRYLVVRCGIEAQDLECVHDDFGNLVPLRMRLVTSDFASAASWRAV